MMTYPLVYMLIWTIPTTIRIYQATTGRSAPFGIATIDKACSEVPTMLSCADVRGIQACIVIQGFADAIVYGLNENTWYAGVLAL